MRLTWAWRASPRGSPSRTARGAVRRASLLLEGEVPQTDSRLHQQILQPRSGFLGELFAGRDLRAAEVGPFEGDAPAETAGDAGADRGSHLVLVERTQQLASRLIERRAQRARIAAEQSIEPALQGLLGGREHERQHQGRHDVERESLFAGPGGVQILTDQYDAQVDRRQHSREQRPWNAALENAPRIERRVARHQVGEREGRQQHSDPDHRQGHANRRNLEQRERAIALEPPAEKAGRDVHEGDREPEDTLAGRGLPVPTAGEAEALDQ